MTAHDDDNQIHLSLLTLSLVILLIVYITSGPLLKRFHIKIFHASGVTMLIGGAFTYLIKAMYPTSNFIKGFTFNEVFFFTFVLPWIIFRLGYNAKFNLFILYFKYIAAFAFIGTLINFVFVSGVTYYLNKGNFFRLTYNEHDKSEFISLGVYEIFQFSAAISASDSIAVIDLLCTEESKKINAIIEGDAVINNALSIALFNIARTSFINTNSDDVSMSLWFEMIYKCTLLFIVSFIIGALVGILSALFLKWMKKYRLNRIQEISILLLFAFIAYILCDWLNLSPMISLLASALCMSHYTFYNLAFQTREESTVISIVLNTLAEAFVFSTLGMMVVYFATHALSVPFFVSELVIIIVARLISIFGISALMNIMTPFTLELSNKGILTAIGSMRGAISFGLVVSIHTTNQLNKEVMTSTIVYIIFITNIVFTFVLPLFLPKPLNESVQKSDIYTFLHPNTDISGKQNIDELSSDNNNNTSITKKVEQYDETHLLPSIVVNWPEIKEDNDALAQLIQRSLYDWSMNKQNVTGNSIESEGYYKVVGGIGLIESRKEEDENRMEMEIINKGI